MNALPGPAVVIRKMHRSIPGYVRILPGTDPELIARLDEAGFDTRELDFTRTIEAMIGDIFALEVEAIKADQVPVLDELARLSQQRRCLVILPCSLSQGGILNVPDRMKSPVHTDDKFGQRLNSPVHTELITGSVTDMNLSAELKVLSPTARLLTLFESPSKQLRNADSSGPQKSYFLEYQAVAWAEVSGQNLRDAIITAHAQNGLRSLFHGCFVIFGSLFAAVNGIVFGAVSPLAVVVILICHLLGHDVAGWRSVVWFLTGPALCMALFVGMNSFTQITFATAVWFAAEWVAQGGNPLEIMIPTVIGMTAFLVANRIQYTVDLRDLLICLFDREIEHGNPEFHDPDKRQSIGSGEFILTRLQLPIWRLFNTSSVSQIFVSHRNSQTGIEVATILQNELEKCGGWSVFLDRTHLTGGLWRDQLADGFRGRGVILCVLTPDNRDKLRWVRRELFAACLLYRSYGFPIPVIIEAGLTLDEVLGYEEAHGRHNTPLHKVRHKLVSVTWDADKNREQFAKELSNTIQKAVADEAYLRTPLVLSHGVTALAGQFVEMSAFVTFLAACGFGASSAAFRFVLLASCFVLATDFGGSSVYRLLPAWAGGIRPAGHWTRPMMRRLRSSVGSAMIAISVFVALARRDFESAFLVALFLGVSFNTIDHELWQARRLADGVLRPDNVE
jgi:hypothetical protein